MKNLTYSLSALLIIFTLNTNAQKLPGTQFTSLWIPPNAKIDGKVSEWENKLQAYNKATNVLYTLANDDNDLYFAVKATDPLVIRKILNGGITLDIQYEKKDALGLIVTYPVFARTERPIINLNDKPERTKDAALDKKKLDSFVYTINRRFTDKSKEIKVQGTSLITDSLISIYNEHGIKAAVAFDDQAAYVYELIVPLKYLNSQAVSSGKFKYTITLSGSPQRDGVTITQVSPTVVKVQVIVGKG